MHGHLCCLTSYLGHRAEREGKKSQLFLALVKILPFALTFGSGRLTNVTTQAWISTGFSLTCLAAFQHTYFKLSGRVKDLTRKELFLLPSTCFFSCSLVPCVVPSTTVKALPPYINSAHMFTRLHFKHGFVLIGALLFSYSVGTVFFSCFQ